MQNKMRNLLVLSGVLSSVLSAGMAHAESTSESLTRIEAETMVLRAREKQLEVQASIVGKQNEIVARQTMANVITQTTVVGDPVIRGIDGIGKKMFATLQLADGGIVDVQAGDVLSSGMKIISIRSGEVIAQSKNQRVRLASYAQSSGFNPNYPGTGIALPRGAR